ncbi:porin [Oceaniglobus indicus]|uniref:porin n=1 Tax=Oceaniglobus indicus TaxID=2047749 RepID=UPI0013046A0B|nr:porin [Oceaniglobus indicus]
MKKVLFATTAIVLTAGAAAAQNVTISGTARAGLNYVENRGLGQNDTIVEHRLRFNIDAAKETDSGVTFGGRTRIQYDENNSASALNAAYVYAEYNGLRVEVGNANTAMDTVALMFNAELGFIGQTFGSYNGQAFNAYRTGAYGAGQTNRMGVFGSYSIAGFNLKASYLTPDQLNDPLPAGVKEEFQMAADYNFGAFTIAGAFGLNAGFIDNRDEYFLGGEYAFNPDGNVGLHINHTNFSGVGDMTTVTLYGNYQFGAITARGYIANNDLAGNKTDVAVGVGADYDLGGATLAGGIERDYNEDMRANLGVKFSF